MTQRVLVTGLGVVSCCGLGVRAVDEALAARRPCFSPLPFPAAGFPHLTGGVGPARAELATLVSRRKDLKLMTRDTLLAVAAGVLAWRDAGLPEGSLPGEEVGLFLGVGAEKGEVTDLAPAVAVSLVDGKIDLGRLTGQGLDRVNPLDALKTLPNMALAHLAIRLGLQGPCAAFCGTADAGLLAVAEAREAVARGECRAALAGGTDCLVSLAGYVQAWRAGSLPPGTFPGEAAAVLLLEPEAAFLARGGCAYGPQPEELTLAELEQRVGRCGVASGPLALAAGYLRAGRSLP